MLTWASGCLSPPHIWMKTAGSWAPWMVRRHGESPLPAVSPGTSTHIAALGPFRVWRGAGTGQKLSLRACIFYWKCGKYEYSSAENTDRTSQGQVFLWFHCFPVAVARISKLFWSEFHLESMQKVIFIACTGLVRNSCQGRWAFCRIFTNSKAIIVYSRDAVTEVWQHSCETVQRAELLVVTIQHVALGHILHEVIKAMLLDSKASWFLDINFALATDTLFFSCLAAA